MQFVYYSPPKNINYPDCQPMVLIYDVKDENAKLNDSF